MGRTALDDLEEATGGKRKPTVKTIGKDSDPIGYPPPAPTSEKRSPDSVFESAAKGRNSGRKFRTPPDIGRGFNTIVVDLFESGYDVTKEYSEIAESLRIKGSLTPGSVQAASNNTEEMARRAYRLYIVGTVEVEAYVRDTDSIVGAMRDAAIAELEIEKRTMVKDSDGKTKPSRSKQITDADVTAMAARLWPDEWTNVTRRREQALGMRKYLENLADLAKSRCFTVRRLAPNGEA